MKALLLTALILVAYSECHADVLTDNLARDAINNQRMNEQFRQNNQFRELQATQQQILDNQQTMKWEIDRQLKAQKNAADAMEWDMQRQVESEKRANDAAWWENYFKHANDN